MTLAAQLREIDAELRGPMRLSELLAMVKRAMKLNTLVPAKGENLSIAQCRVCDRPYVSEIKHLAPSKYQELLKRDISKNNA